MWNHGSTIILDLLSTYLNATRVYISIGSLNNTNSYHRHIVFY